MDASSPFELKVKIAEKLININYVGYGVSQCLPFLVEMFSRNKGTWYAIQQPEVHLHPKAQAALGNLFYSLSISEDKNFLIETHSDYIIDRFRLNCRQAANKPVVDSQVLYFERTPTGNTVYPIEIDDRGNYSENQPETFRDFFIKEQLELLE
jgi:predicted ATPase